MPKRERSGEVSRPGPRRRADQREALEPHLHRARARPLADDDVDLVVLERRIEDLLDRRRHAVNLVDEEHFVLGEVGDDADQVARLLDRRPGCRPHRHAHLVADDVRERRLAEAGRPVQQHVIERLAALPGGGNRDLQVLANAILADVVVELARAQPRFVLRVFVDARRGHHAVVRHLATSRNACFRMRSKLRVGGRSERLDGGIGGFLGERPMIPQVHERRDDIVAHDRRVGRGIAGGNRDRLRPRQPIFQLEDDALGCFLADAGDGGEAREVAALDGANQLERLDARQAPRARPSGRCR